MNELAVPPAPHWYKSAIVACALDNTLVYGSKHDIVVLKEQGPSEPLDVQMIHGAHFKPVTSVSLNRNWNAPHSYVVSVGEDNLMKVWDLKTFEKKTSSKDHVEHKGSVIGAIFAGDDRVVSATSNGLVNVWNINANNSKTLDDLFKGKVTLTCLSSCPHASWLTAFGLNNGAVIVADLRRNGQVLYKLRGHYQSVVSLSWCPAPINVFPQCPNNKVKNKSEASTTSSKESAEDKKTENGMSKESPCDDLVQTDENDFLKECANLKNKILGLSVDDDLGKKEKPKIFLKEITKETEDDEKDREQEVQNRSLPHIYDGDFLDDSGFTSSPTDEKPLEIDQERQEEVKEELTTIVKADVSDSGCEGQTADIEDQHLKIEEKKHSDKSEQDVKTDEKPQDLINAESDKPIEIIDELNGNDGIQEKSAKDEENSNIKAETSTEKKVQEQEIKENGKNEESTEVEIKTTEKDAVSEAGTSAKEEKVAEEEPRTEYLLASVGKDRSVYIWRAGTDGRMQTFFKASTKGQRKDKNISTWISLCWITPNTILTSSAQGEILVWPVPKPKDSHKQFTILHYEHSSLIFNLATPPKYFTAYDWRQDWRDKSKLGVWSWGQDGKLINYDINGEKICYSCTVVTATITCFGSSALDPNRLAVGLRDGGVRIWDLSLPHSKSISMQKYHQKYTQKISAIGWHPLKETIVGFGTEEGRVGFIDLSSKKTTLFRHYFRTHVYKVEWGPIVNDPDNLGLYVLAEGKIGIYDMQKPSDDPTLLELPEQIYVYKFAWKPNFTLLLISGKDGSLTVLKTDLTAIITGYLNDKGLNAIVWHPHAFIDGTDISPSCYYFAATTTKGIVVVDCDAIEQSDNLINKIVVSLEGHLRPPMALAWCPFEGNRIVSTAADGLTHVYDVTTKSIIATFVESYFSQNTVLAWSPLNPDLIIMGDKTLRVWSILENPPKCDDEFLTSRKRLLNKSSKPNGDKNKIKILIPSKIKNVPKNFIVPALYTSSDENISSQVSAMRKLLNDGEHDVAEGELNPFQLFGSKEDVAFLLNASYQQQNKEGKHKSCELIALWKGNIGEYIRNAINDNRVTPSIISLAPMVSPRLWQDACLTYAKKLQEEANSDPLETAMYFLACHKVTEAINCLCDSSMFREALALAKHRLPENSEIIAQVVQKWAVHCTNCGNFENAAYCYISIKDYENAAKIVARRFNLEMLEFALELAEKAGNQGLIDSIKFKITEYQKAEKEVGDIAEIAKSLETEIPSKLDAASKIVAENVDEASESSSTNTIENEPGSDEEENKVSSDEKNNQSEDKN